MLTDLPLLELAPPHERWPVRAERDAGRVRRALAHECHAVHHVGSTSVPGLHAVPVIDLLAEVVDPTLSSAARLRLMAHGFLAHAQHAECAVFIVQDAVTGCCQVELRCYEAGHPEAADCVAFFAYLRAAPALAAAYHELKCAWRAQHGPGTVAYEGAKRAWIAAQRPAWSVR